MVITVYKTSTTLPFTKADKSALALAGRFMGPHQEHRDLLLSAARQPGRPGGLGHGKIPDIRN